MKKSDKAMSLKDKNRFRIASGFFLLIAGLLIVFEVNKYISGIALWLSVIVGAFQLRSTYLKSKEPKDELFYDNETKSRVEAVFVVLCVLTIVSIIALTIDIFPGYRLKVDFLGMAFSLIGLYDLSQALIFAYYEKRASNV